MHLRFLSRCAPLFIACCAFLSAGWQVEVRTSDQGIRKGNPAPALEGVLIVKFRSQPAGKTGRSGFDSFDALAQSLQFSSMRPLFAGNFPHGIAGKATIRADQLASLQRIYELRYEQDTPPHLAAALLSSDPNVEYAEPRYLYRTTGWVSTAPEAMRDVRFRVEPNDPQFSEMSHLSHVGLPQAWDVVKASDGDVVISVVDAGTDWQHPDLISNIWQNPGELDGNDADDDGNGFVDDVRGWNFANDSNDPTGLAQTDANATHGTMVAGIASAVTDNDEGIAGASWNARLMPVNAGCANTDNAVCYGFDGILYAALNGADVINASWGGPDSFLGREAVRMALDLGALLVVSAGNGNGFDPEGINIDENISYPAAYDRVLVVGSTEKRFDTKASFSNFGIGVDVFAPGVTLNTTIPGGRYTTLATGTSFSTPVVAGLAAMLMTIYPDWSLDRVREQIRATANPIDGFNPPAFTGLLGSGRINAFKAVTDITIPALRVRDVELIDIGNNGIIRKGERVIVKLNMINYLAHAENVSISISSLDTNIDIESPSVSLAGIANEEVTTVEFAFNFEEEVPNDHAIVFRLDVAEDGTSNTELLRFVVNRITHDTGVLQMTLTDEGNIGWTGFQDDSNGQGFKYLGVDWLFEGGILVGTSQNKISDSIRNTANDQQDEDLSRPEDGFFGIIPSDLAEENGIVILTDEAAANPIGINIQQESYADKQNDLNDFIVLRYVLSHSDSLATAAIDNLHLGLFTDWDLTQSGAADYARFDEGQRMGIVQPTATDPILLFATKLLSPNVPYSYRSINNEEIFDSRSGGDGFKNDEKWAFMTEGIQVEEVDDTDVSTLITAGPLRINPGQRTEVAFALMAARTETELEEFANRAQWYWDNVLELAAPYPVNVDEALPEGEYRLDAAFPNPSAGSISLGYFMPAPGTVEIVVYDILGREVSKLIEGVHTSGQHVVHWDGRNQDGTVVSNGVYYYRMSATSSVGHFNQTQKLVIVR